MTKPSDTNTEPDRTAPDGIATNAAREGAEPFRVLHRRYADRVMGYALRLTGGRRADAEDLVQDTFVAAYRSQSGFRGKSGFLAWLLGIATRRWRDAARRTVAPAAPPEIGTENADELPDDRRPFEERVADAAVLEAALSRLPERERIALLLIVSQQLTYAEAARATGEPEGTVKWRVHRAVKEMNRLLAPTFASDTDPMIADYAHAEPPATQEHATTRPAHAAP
ncbi:MAG: RNA polymerase sigma factor [Akkermansiaceae bacterium]|nr:RNA polymerase sigma factor [Armatimonadota bacterium]